MDLARLKRMKKLSKLTAQDISVESGIPLSTVQKIFAGQVENPREKTITAIEAVLDRHYPPEARLNTDSSAHSYSYYPLTGEQPLFVREDNLAYDYGYYDEYYNAGNRAYAEMRGREYIDYELDSMYREYTVDDYYAIPDDMRVELIDGHIYNLSAPSVEHQHIVGSIYYYFRNYINEGHDGCRVFMAPLDVRLDLDNKTMIQPDMIGFCEHKKEGEEDEEDPRLRLNKNIEGAPDFIVEVVSRWSYVRDSSLKYNKYLRAGVKEYWLVDPFRKTVTVNDFMNDTCVVYTFDDKVPVSLTGGELVIDFRKVVL